LFLGKWKKQANRYQIIDNLFSILHIVHHTQNIRFKDSGKSIYIFNFGKICQV